MNENNAYVDVIKGVMVEKGLSQQKLADLLGVNQTTVSQWLREKKKPGFDNILRFCAVFGIKPNEFFGID